MVFSGGAAPRTIAEIAAGLVVSHPVDGVIRDQDRPDPIDDRDAWVRRLLDAFVELRELAGCAHVVLTAAATARDAHDVVLAR
jgi:hypothetical protein